MAKTPDKGKYCGNCIMPRNYPGISFNREDVCDFCVGYTRPKYLGRDKLIELLNSAEKRGEYDCVVPLSGGKDSTYILYYAVKQLKLRCIAVNYDSGFQTDMARENVRKTCEILSVPLVALRSRGDIQSRLLRETFLFSRALGLPFVLRSCGNCEVILRTSSIRVARAYGIPFILWGSSALESHDRKNYEIYRFGERGDSTPRMIGANLGRCISARTSAEHTGILKVVYEIGYRAIRYAFLMIIQRVQMGVPVRYALRPFSVLPFSQSRPQFVHFFDYIDWDSIANMKLLENVLGWKRPADKLFRFDCKLHCLANDSYLKRFGISHDGINLCLLVREGKISREEAMLREEEIQDSVDGECREIRQRCGLRG